MRRRARGGADGRRRLRSAPRRRQHAAEALEQRGLSRSVRTDQAEHLAAPDRERHAGQSGQPAVALGEITDEQQGFARNNGGGRGRRCGQVPNLPAPQGLLPGVVTPCGCRNDGALGVYGLTENIIPTVPDPPRACHTKFRPCQVTDRPMMMPSPAPKATSLAKCRLSCRRGIATYDATRYVGLPPSSRDAAGGPSRPRR